MTLGPPKGADTPPRGEEGGPQNSIFEIMPLGPTKESDTPPRGPPKGGEATQNSIFEIMTLGPPKETDTPPRVEEGALEIRFSES